MKQTPVRLIRGAAILVLAIAAAGCGGPPGNAAVRATVRAFLNATVHGDGAIVCSLFTPAIARSEGSTVGGSCAHAVDEYDRPSAAEKRQILEASISDVQVHGNTATVSLRPRGWARTSQRFALTRRHGRWFVFGDVSHLK